MLQNVKIITLRMPFRMGTVNSYLIQTTTGHVLIDTGGSNTRKILHSELESAGCTSGSLKVILLTHGDFDHIGNAAYLRSTFGAKLVMHRDDAGIAERGDMFVNRRKPNFLIRKLLPVFSGFGKSERFTPNILLHDGLDLSPYGLEGKVIELPGHSKGSIGFLIESGELFCGDLFENTKVPAVGSIMDDPVATKGSVSKIETLMVRKVYPGHGQPFAMELLKKD